MTTKRETSIARWLLPTTFGPALSTYGAVGLYTMFGGHDGVARWAILILGLLVGTLWAAVYTFILALVDVALLALRQRTLPGGKDRKSTRLNSSHIQKSRMPSSA